MMRAKLTVVMLLATLMGCNCDLEAFMPTIRRLTPIVAGELLNMMPPIIDTKPDLPTANVYDYVVVGSGSGGAVVASRLSEDPSVSVLVLELGTPQTIIESVPLFVEAQKWSRHNWYYKMEPQPNACRSMTENRCHLPRGRAVGGSTAISYMIYSRGNADDYNKLGTTCPGWSYNDVLPYFLKAERTHMQPGSYEAGYHGDSGPLTTEHFYHSPAGDAFIKAGIELNMTTVDYNGVNQTGFSYIQATLNQGKTWSVTSAYLQPAINRENFRLLSEALVTKVIIDNNVATGVTYTYRGANYTVNARKEVILSAGTFNTPQLLMLSGIGPKEQLDKFGIDVVKYLPVGLNLHDHVTFLGASFTLPKENMNILDFLNPNVILQWAMYGKGMMTTLGGVEELAYFKTNRSTETSNAPDMELMVLGIGNLASDYGLLYKNTFDITEYYYQELFKPLEGVPGITIVPMMLHPKSRGRVELKSTNPADLMRIYGNYFGVDQDVERMVDAIKFLMSLENTNAFKAIGAKFYSGIIPDCRELGYPSDDYWRCAVQFLVTSLHQQSGTCKMGPTSDNTTVIDNELKVHGIGNLRVVDTSIFPFAISAHYNAPGIMIGEKAADMIKNNAN